MVEYSSELGRHHRTQDGRWNADWIACIRRRGFGFVGKSFEKEEIRIAIAAVTEDGSVKFLPKTIDFEYKFCL